jgi:predicted transcriptional regulator
VAQTLTIPDEVYQQLRALAEAQGQTPERLIEGWVAEHAAHRRTFHSEEEFMRGLGMNEEDIAWVEAQPINEDPTGRLQ